MKYNSTCVFLMAWMLSACSQPRVDGTIFTKVKRYLQKRFL